MSGVESKVAEAEAKKSSRPIFEFDLPPSLSNGYVTIGMVQLSAREELMSAKRAQGDTHRIALELTKEAIREVDGKRVTTADGTVDDIVEKADPRVRQLMMQAYADIHNPSDQEEAVFLKSRRVKVG